MGQVGRARRRARYGAGGLSPLQSDPRLVRELQERAARALPAEHVEHVGGWWLRHAPGCAWWVGTVLPHGDAAPEELPDRIAAAEAFSARRGTGTAFQITPGVCPDLLDGTLASHGYRLHTPMSLQAAPVEQVLTRPPAGRWEVHMADRPLEAWWTVWLSGIHHGEGADRRSEEDLFGRVESPVVFACATSDGHTASIARAVADSGWTGVFDVVTLPQARGEGAARAVLAALAGWAGEQDCSGLYLQVERDNVAALGLYGSAGFGEVARYHYRTSENVLSQRR